MTKAAGLRAQTVSAVVWNAIGQVGRQGISVAVSILLARLLTPSDFGLVAMLLLFQEVANALINSGLTAPLIQARDISTQDKSTVFWFNISVGLLCYLLLLGCAPYVASFYGEPRLSRLVAYFGLIFLIHSFGNVQIALLLRSLDYRRLNLIALVGVLLSGIVAVMMAVNGYGVDSLLGHHISYALITTALYWIYSEWRPSFAFDGTSFRRLFGFGSKVLFVSLLDKTLGSVDNVVVARLQGPALLGQYFRGKTTRDLPLTNVMTVLTSLVFPVFSRIESPEEWRRAHSRFIGVVSYVTAPFMVGMAILAEPLIVVLYSDKWRPAVPFLQVFCAFGITVPLNSVIVQALLSSGRADVFLKVEVVKKAVVATAMIAGAFLTPLGLVVSLGIGNYVALCISLRVIARTLGTSLWGVVRDLLPGIGLSLLSGIPIYYTATAPWPGDLVRVVASTGVGVVSYVALSALVGSRDYLFAKRLIGESLAQVARPPREEEPNGARRRPERH